MKKGWTTTKLVAVANLAALDVIIGFAASGIDAVTGIAMAGGVLNSLTGPLLIVICLLVVGKFGAASLFLYIVSTLTLPLAYSGPPGFWPKIPIYVVMGVLVDSLYLYLRKYSRLIACFVVGGFEDVFVAFAVVAVGQLFNVPGIDKVLTFIPLPVFTVMVFLVGAVDGSLGWLVYNRIKDTAVVRRIQG